MGFDVFEIMFFVFMAVGIAGTVLKIFTGDPDEVITGNTTDWTTGWSDWFDEELDKEMEYLDQLSFDMDTDPAFSMFYGNIFHKENS